MNKEQIIQMARDAHRDLVTIDYPGHLAPLDPWTTRLCERFSAAIIAATKEEDAKICEEFGKPNSMQSMSESIHTETASKQIAAAIRESKP
jgi:hypothetical protein